MFYYVDGVCGSGKTTVAINKMAVRVKNGETLIYATATKKLLEQTKSGLEKLGVEVELIVSDSDNQPDKQQTYGKQTTVSQRLLSAINGIEKCPRVILCVTQTLIKVASKISDEAKVALFVDEGFVAVDSGSQVFVTSGEAQGVAYKLGLSGAEPEGYVKNGQYQLTDSLKQLKEYLSNPLYTIKYEASDAKLQWVSSLIISDFSKCFSEVIILSASHEDTIQSYAIKASGEQQKDLDWGLDTEHYSTGKVSLYWVLTDLEWRTTFKDKLSDDELQDIVLDFERQHWSNDYLSVKRIGGLGVKLTVQSHGFNGFSDIDNFINLHTQMPIPYLNTFLKEEFKMSDEQIRASFYHHSCYQSAMRTSLRKSSKDAPIDFDTSFCFGDKPTAMYFASKLSESVNVEYCQLEIGKGLDVKQPRKDKISDNKQEQKNRYADKKKLLEFGLKEEVLNDGQIYLRDWRRANTGKRLTKKLYEETVAKFN
jgi:hypothetical protein